MLKPKIWLVVGVILGLLLYLSARPAQAMNWQQVAVSQEGDMRQFIDVDSIQRSGHFVTVDSYTEVSQVSDTEIETYRTEYDCDRNLYRDLEPEQPLGNWKTMEADPLNEAAQLSACSKSS
ncbi:MAG: hypothetical protein WA902_08545 [Thermosynechococcaceae cyanobacterium]